MQSVVEGVKTENIATWLISESTDLESEVVIAIVALTKQSHPCTGITPEWVSQNTDVLRSIFKDVNLEHQSFIPTLTSCIEFLSMQGVTPKRIEYLRQKAIERLGSVQNSVFESIC